MRKLLPLLLICLVAGTMLPPDARAAAAGAKAGAAAPTEPDSQRMEADLQRLTWPQFKSVVEAVPKLKADIDAYGPLGWQYVKTKYATYAWKKNIDRMDDEQKRRLADLIRGAKAGVKPVARSREGLGQP